MMNNIASCGHKIRGIGTVTLTREHTRDGRRAVGRKVLCKRCVKSYRREGKVLRNMRAMREWLDGK